VAQIHPLLPEQTYTLTSGVVRGLVRAHFLLLFNDGNFHMRVSLQDFACSRKTNDTATNDSDVTARKEATDRKA
jgi:hypothetical protein